MQLEQWHLIFTTLMDAYEISSVEEIFREKRTTTLCANSRL
jgi:hypothetical protein